MANLHKSLKSLKVKVNQILPGYLGVSDTLINVPNRPGFSYVRLLGNPNELLQAYNTSVTPIYGFPVLVQWTGNKYVVIGKDTNRYSQWNYSAYLPLHGETHQWKGGDMTWILSEQLYPLAVSPSGTSLLIAPYAYAWGGNWVFGGNSDTTTITLPSNPAKQSVLLLYLDGPTGNPTWLPGTEAPLYTDKNSLLPYLPNFSSSLGIPLAMVRIPSGTTSWTWDNLYDVRQLFVGFTTTSGSSTTGSSGGNVYGPATNNDSYIPQWNGANSKILKNGVQLVTSVGTPGSDSSIPSEKAVRTALSTVSGSSGTGNFSITGTSVANHFISLADSSGKTGIDSGYGPGSFAPSGTNYLYYDQTNGTGSYGVLIGIQNGANRDFQVSHLLYTTGTLGVYLNGQLLDQGNNWTETSPASGTFNLAVAPIAADTITAVYGSLAVGGASQNEWNSIIGTFTFASSTTINVSNGATGTYNIGDKLRFQNNNSGIYLYDYIVNISGTLLTILGNTVPNATLTNPYYSRVETPLGFPSVFSWTPTPTNFTVGSGALIAEYLIHSRMLFFTFKWTLAADSAVSGDVQFTLPATVASGRDNTTLARLLDSGVTTYFGIAYIDGTTSKCIVRASGVSGAYIVATTLSSTIPWTWKTTDAIFVSGIYFI
jgi:hypothetical protein